MSVRDFPPRPQGATPDSVPYQNWLDALGQRQNIDLQQELTSVDSADELLIFDVSETGLVKTKKATVSNLAAAIGGGDVDGPSSATDSAIALFDTGSGKLIKDSATLLSALMKFSDSRFKVGSFTRDLSIASGNQAITGVGFQPKFIIFGSAISGAFGACVGVSDVSANMGFQFTNTSGFYPATTFCIYIAPVDISNFQIAVVNSFDADGFTVGWSKFGTLTGTGTVWYAALR